MKLCSLAMAVLSLAPLAPAGAQCLPSPVTLMSGQDNDFGAALDVDGTTLVVGAPWGGLDPAVTPHQAVYVYDADDSGEWQLAQKLLPPSTGQWNIAFGHSVAIDGDVLVVGDPSANLRGGFAAIYERDPRSPGAWQVAATFSGEPYESLGYDVAVEQGLVVVGAPFRAAGGDGGRVHVYEKSDQGWQEVGSLTGSEHTAYLGWSVATNGAVVLAGTPRGDGNEQCGAAWFFERKGMGRWMKQKVFLEHPFGGCSGSEFGKFVSLSGERAAISFEWSGVTIYEREPASGTWHPSALFFVPASIHSGLLLDGERLFVSTGGGVHAYQHVDTGWAFEKTLAGQTHGFGAGVAVREQETFIGDPSFQNEALDAFGAVHVFGSPDRLPSWNVASSCESGTTSSGCQPVLSACGVPSAKDPSGFQIVACPLAGGHKVKLDFSVNGLENTPWNAATSFKCSAAPTVFTSNSWSLAAGGECEGTVAVDLDQWWTGFPSPSNPGPGDRVWTQVWFDGPAYGSGSEKGGWTNAIAFTVLP